MNTMSLNPSTNRRTEVQLMSSLLLFATLGFSFPTLSKPKDPVAWITQQFSYRHARRDLGPFKHVPLPQSFLATRKEKDVCRSASGIASSWIVPNGLGRYPWNRGLKGRNVTSLSLHYHCRSLHYHYTTITTIRFSNKKNMARPCNLTVSWRHRQTLKFLVRMRFLELWELKLGPRSAGAKLRLHTSTKSSNEMTKKHDMPVCHYMLWMLLWYIPLSTCKEPLPG